MSTISTILYVDDDRDDCYFQNESFISSGLNASPVYVSHGQEAISYRKHTRGLLSSLVIPHLNMPRANGKVPLAFLKDHTRYQRIPVVILSTSENKEEMDACAAQGAHGGISFDCKSLPYVNQA